MERKEKVLRAAAVSAVASAAAAVGSVAVRWALRLRRRRANAARMRREVRGALDDIARLPGWDPSKACVILSGGLDTSISAEIGKEILGLTDAFTVLCGEEATDRRYAAAVAEALGLRHHVLDLTLEQLLEQLPWAIRVLKTFDPMSLRNNIAIAAALRSAHAKGFTCAVTGDGADEILGGYNFTHRMSPEKWLEHRAHMATVMSFDSVPLGEDLGILVASPYTRQRVVDAALTMDKNDSVQQHGGASLGKIPLRHAFPAVVSAWRTKDPIEVGCGSTQLGSRPWLGRKGYFDDSMSNDDFKSEVEAAKAKHDVVIRDREHLAYFKAFLGVFPGGDVPGKPRYGSDPCPVCHYQMSSRFQTFCVTCGHYDASLRKPQASSGSA